MNDASRRITRITLTALTVAVLTFTGIQAGMASPGEKGGPGYHGAMMGCPQVDEKTRAAREKFLDQTVDLRKQMMENRARMRALMHSASPDPDQVSKLAGKIFDLREQLRVKARESGLQGTGPMAMMGACGCGGPMGMGTGMPGHHMMMKGRM
ncbi:Spy/CpxP family protein refolding chaperone [Thermodesulfobacteriota bacterium B35]